MSQTTDTQAQPETVETVYAFQMRLGSLLGEFLRGEIDGARIEFDREAWPTRVTVKTWKKQA